MGVRLSDDIKESVRKAGFSLLRALASATARLAPQKGAEGGEGEGGIGGAISVLLGEGLGSPLEPVRALALSTLSTLIKVHLAVPPLYFLHSLISLPPPPLP